MTSKVEKKELSHETILQSAARLVRDKGIAGARVADVMKGAGLTVGGFYAHFASKAELVDETLRRAGAELRERLFARLDEKPAEDRAEVILKRYLSAGHRDLDNTEGCPLPAVVGEVGATESEHRDVVAELTETLARGIEGELPAVPILGRRQLALGLVALMYGGLSLARAVRGTALSDEIIKACRAVGIFAARAQPTARR
jgi:TetR/AcrR family transcriptional repressor of nem operon